MQVSHHYYQFDIDRKSLVRSTAEGSTAERPPAKGSSAKGSSAKGSPAKGSSAKGSRLRLKVHWYAVKFSSPPFRLF